MKRFAHFFARDALQASSIAAEIADWQVQGRSVVHNDPAVVPGLIG